MYTKLISFLLFLFLLVLPLSGQLTAHRNGLRPGDSLVKQQVGYKDPGPAGPNREWDFSGLKTFNDRYTVSYALPPEDDSSYVAVGEKRYEKRKVAGDELVTGTEHNTVYYYRMDKDTLVLLGHENPVVRLEYTRPMPLLHFPFNYGDKDSAEYTSEVLYSSILPMQARGSVVTTADAYGKMILPDDVTLDSVLRVKTKQVIENIPSDSQAGTEKQQTVTETCRWYLKGYRYPVFETIKGLKKDGSTLFATAFYYPLKDHQYLEDDPANTLPEKGWTTRKTGQHAESSESMLSGSTYRFYPNPTKGILYIDLSLELQTDVDIVLYSADGKIRRKMHCTKREGRYSESIDCSGLPAGTYLLRLIYGQTNATEIVIKN